MEQIIQQNLDKRETYPLLDMMELSLYWKDCDGHYLGCNRHFFEVLGLTDRSQVIGKTDYDFFRKEDADRLRKNDALAIKQAKFLGEEWALINGQLQYYSSTKIRLVNMIGEVIGIFGSSVCITDIRNKLEQEKQLAIREEELKTAQIVDLVPAFIYWKHKNERYIACNQYQKDVWGFDIAGKTEYELWPEEADRIHAIDEYVLKHGNYSGEEIATDPINGTTKYFFSSKRQLRDSKGNVIGVIGVSMDITDRKNTERLILENQSHKTIHEQQKKFKQIVDQVVHDIRSPIASMQMILPLCNSLPENLRVSLNKSATRILDIANNLLSKFKPKETAVAEISDEILPAPTLISAELLEIITEKKYEYTKLPIDINTNISQVGYFVFINTDIYAFKRMISNLINNAVEAFEGRIGEINVFLDVIDTSAQIVIQDNGKGMPEEVKTNILNNITVTAGKDNGHGIGFNQVRMTLEKSHGTLSIESTIDVGTKIILDFPRIEAPHWIAEKIELYNGDLIVILDDDDSIHGAWEARFKQAVPDIERQHFKDGKEAIAFINNMSVAQKKHVFLLTDYELLSQDLHGLDVVEQTGIKRSILVTSHHNNPTVRDLAQSTKTRILPKPLASEIVITILKDDTQDKITTELKKVDLVCVDDDEDFLNVFVRVIQMDNKIADKYYTTHELLNNIHHYPKDVPIFLDNQFQGENITGVELAKQLHELGYHHLYLFSGHDFSGDSSIPSYLTPVLKTDMDFVEKLLNNK